MFLLQWIYSILHIFRIICKMLWLPASKNIFKVWSIGSSIKCSFSFAENKHSKPPNLLKDLSPSHQNKSLPHFLGNIPKRLQQYLIHQGTNNIWFQLLLSFSPHLETPCLIYSEMVRAIDMLLISMSFTSTFFIKALLSYHMN